MELMSSAFLCVLVALLPQTLVKARNRHQLTIDSKSNDSAIRVMPSQRKPILLNINAPPLVSNISKLQSVFNDFACKSCNLCMHKAIKAHTLHVRMSNSRPSLEELRDDVMTNEVESYLHSAHSKIEGRSRRDVKTTPETTIDVTPKRVKTKKSRLHKAVTVTRYDMDGEVYALKVKETQVSAEQQNDTKAAGTCYVYSVKKSLPCDSQEGEYLLSEAKRKANKKKAKKEQDKKITVTHPSTGRHATTTHASAFKKREVDISQIPENFMPSIEDFF